MAVFHARRLFNSIFLTSKVAQLEKMSSYNKNPRILAVDLDGTLLKTDMLFETFCSALSRDWLTVPRAILTLFKGRAALKRMLATAALVDVTKLPYNETVLDFIRQHRRCGGLTVLVSASDHKNVEAVADHLGLFDEVFGSDGETNLKGRQKGDFLSERYKSAGYIYMGDAAADIEVWNRADKIVTVNAKQSTKLRIETLKQPIQHLETHKSSAQNYFKALRPHQWLKNLLIFVPLLVGHQFDLPTAVHSLLAYTIFCLVASGVYVLNDLVDLRSDRAHPRKCFRPFASGDVPLEHGLIMALALLSVGIGLSLWVGWQLALVVAVYLVLTTSYSFTLKRLIGLDLCILAILYTARVAAGSAITGITLSVWLIAFSLFFFFALAALKRLIELVDVEARNETSAKGRGYVIGDLAVLLPTTLTSGYLSVLVLTLYVLSDQVKLLYSQPAALWGVCVVLFYWITRAVILANRGVMDDDPVVFAITDRVSHVCLLAIIGCAGAGVLL